MATRDGIGRIAATFPMRTVHHRFMIEGDEMFGFDPNAFVQRLIEETGVPHTWKPISTRIHERGLLFRFTRVARRDDKRSELTHFVDEREARLQTREVFGDCWDKYHHLQPSKLGAEMYAQSVAWRFADFVIDNIDLAQPLMANKRLCEELACRETQAPVFSGRSSFWTLRHAQACAR